MAVASEVLLAQLLNKSLKLPVMPRQHGKVVIVTGGGRGIGYEVVRHLARLGAHVIIGGRDEQEGLAAIKRICEEYKEAKDARLSNSWKLSTFYFNLWQPFKGAIPRQRIKGHHGKR
ncbi:hypothetical protein CHARACLAT_018679 [Characodon lateralis]|uniref:Uncharacterized protein n=1 Tax=Characodon lateralis TaxID=208331 RepID=A0ABU7DLP2_9TELE|nr:hypothetical protein [Characodon lateralis]